MNRLFSERTALRIMLFIFSGIIVFHLMVLSGIIPYTFVWGGRLKDKEQMVQFEIVSLLINATMLLVVLLKMKIIKMDLPHWLFLLAFWTMAVLFLLNTVGNFLSNNPVEKALFTPLTLLLFLCSLRLALGKKRNSMSIGDTTKNTLQ